MAGDEIHCDSNDCTARIVPGYELNDEQSIALAIQRGWQAWQGTLRSYHRCPAHAVDVTASTPTWTVSINPDGVLLPLVSADEVGASADTPDDASALLARSTGVSRDMQNPHTSAGGDPAGASQDFDHEAATKNYAQEDT